MTQQTREIWDADNHLYEPADAYTRYLPKRYANSIQWIQVNGQTKLMIKGRLTDTIPNPTYDVVASPGAWADYFRGVNPGGKTLRELANPIACPESFRRAEERLTLLDDQSVHACVMFPTTGGMLEERMTDDIELAHAVVHAYNEWLLEEWSFDYRGRIFATPVITLPDVDKAVAELDWCVERGARSVLVNPRPVATVSGHTTSMGQPYFDPFWARVQHHGVPVFMHACDSGYDRYSRDWEGAGAEYQPFKPDAFKTIVYEDARSILDTCAALVAHGVFERHPGVRVGVVENGGNWVPRLLDLFDAVYKKMPGEFAEHPAEQFKRHIWVNPFHEEDMTGLIDLIGADRVLFGSDYPHPEGLADPGELTPEIAALGDPVIDRIMGGNLRELLTAVPGGR